MYVYAINCLYNQSQTYPNYSKRWCYVSDAEDVSWCHCQLIFVNRYFKNSQSFSNLLPNGCTLYFATWTMQLLSLSEFNGLSAYNRPICDTHSSCCLWTPSAVLCQHRQMAYICNCSKLFLKCNPRILVWPYLNKQDEKHTWLHRSHM